MTSTNRFLRTLFGDTLQGHFLNVWTLEDRISRWFSDMDKATQAALNLSRKFNTYFQPGLQPRDLGPRQRGEAATASGIPGLWLDVDILGPAHKRAQLPPKVDDARALIAEFPLRPSIIVNSGHGLQPYWLFRELWLFEGNERQEAMRLEKRFLRTMQSKALAQGWKIDPTADLARVLRPPGTINRKPDLPPVPVSVLEWCDERRYDPSDFEPYLIAVEESADEMMPVGERGDFPPADFTAICVGCAFIRHWRDDAAVLDEPDWYVGITITARCQDGEQLAHEYSSPFPRYSVAETSAKIRHALTDTGPYSCKYIEAFVFSACAECPNRGKVKSPIVLGTSYPKLQTARIDRETGEILDPQPPRSIDYYRRSPRRGTPLPAIQRPEGIPLREFADRPTGRPA